MRLLLAAVGSALLVSFGVAAATGGCLAETPPETPPATQSGDREPAGQVLAQGDQFSIGDTSYAVRLIPAVVGSSELNDLCIWHEGKGWVLDRYKPSLKGSFTCQWPVVCVSTDRSRAVVRVVEQGKPSSRLGVADLAKNQLIASVAPGDFSADAWRFSPDGRYVWAIKGMGKGGFSYFDMEQKKLVAVPVKGMNGDDWHYWSGTLLNEGRSICLFVRHAPWESHFKRVTFSTAKPAEVVVEDDPLRIYQVIRQGEKGLVCRVQGTAYDRPSRIVVVSTETWKIVQEAKGAGEQEALLGTPDPTGQVMYCKSYRSGGGPRDGLSLRDAKDSTELAFVPLGTIFNADWLGPTFSGDGRWALATAPYGHSLTLIDTAKRTVGQKLKIKGPPAGAFLIPPEKAGDLGVLLVITTTLPYE